MSEIERYIDGICYQDPYSALSPDGFYRINNLYVDSPDFKFYNTRLQGIGNRFNMRIRAYGENPKAPYFFEVKHKDQGYIKKYRAKSKVSDIPGFMDQRRSETDPSPNADLFLRLALTYNVEPKIFNFYYRKAYISKLDDYARITFDRNLGFQRETEYRLCPGESATNYDNSFIFPLGCDIILELKAERRVPCWIIDLIKNFGLERGSFSKYSNSVKHVFDDQFFPKIDHKSFLD